MGVLGVAQQGVSVERMDRREPRVPRPGADATLGLQVVEERADGFGIEISDVEHRGFRFAALRGEPQEQADRLAVGAIVCALALRSWISLWVKKACTARAHS